MGLLVITTPCLATIFVRLPVGRFNWKQEGVEFLTLEETPQLVSDVENAIQTKVGLRPRQYRLLHGNIELFSSPLLGRDPKLSDYNIPEESTLHMKLTNRR